MKKMPYDLEQFLKELTHLSLKYSWYITGYEFWAEKLEPLDEYDSYAFHWDAKKKAYVVPYFEEQDEGDMET